MTRTSRWAVLLVVLFLIVSMVIVLLVLMNLGGQSVSWSQEKVLYVKLQGEIPEQRPTDPFSEIFAKNMIDFRDVMDSLSRASQDDKIEGVFFDIRSPGMGWAQVEELRAAIDDFRASGKWTTAFFETNGVFGGGNGSYYVASACDEIVLSPPGEIGITGLRAETPFMRGMFDKLEIEPQFGQRKEYKNAVNTYTERGYTKAHKEAMEALLDSLYDEFVAGIASGRDLTQERARELVDGGPYIASEALELELVDGLAYHDEIVDEIENRVEQDEPFIGIRRYLKGGRPFSHGRTKIALIYAVGTIVEGRSYEDPLAGQLVGSDTVRAAFRTAREDDSVGAVVFRVDSPGGSYVASDLIRRELALTRDAKPVVVSMGNLAASGGYFVSMQADHIFANENTITGSIGVYSGKFVTKKFWNEKIGIRFQGLQRGDNAEFMSSQSKWDARAQERVDRMLDRVYDDFVSKAASGRNMAEDQLESLARGRVWTGRDALARGLVNEIGGLHDALEEAREMAGLEPDEAFRVVVMPQARGLFDSIFAQEDQIRSLPPAVRELLGILRDISSEETNERWLLDRSLPRIR